MSNAAYAKKDLPFEIYEINLLNANEETLLKISEEMGLALNLEEMKKIKQFFVIRVLFVLFHIHEIHHLNLFSFHVL